ncbi:sensor histidine kinase [Flavobacterium sp.]|uniref:ATP-binding protein n=1 Tax=Flavobacterium sp. TaxID=239 RepID=UPI0026349582|nr:sensor histidine kinase [Flavobacterium sp.]
MHRIVLYCLFFAVSSVTFSQVKEEKRFSIYTDTLKLAPKMYRDSTQIKGHLDYIFENFRVDIGNGISLCDYLYNRSREIKKPALMASARNIKASIYALRNDYTNATKYFLEAAELFEKLNIPYSTAIMYNNVGMMYNNTKNKKLALQYFEIGLKVAEKHKLDNPKALIYINLTNLHITENNLDAALETAIKANALCEKLKLFKEQAVNANLIGVIYYYKSDFEKALEYYRLSLKLSKQTGDVHSENTALSNIGEIQVLQNKPEALTTLQACENYFKKIKDYSSLQQVYLNYSTFFRNSNQDKKTIEYLDKLRKVESQLSDSLQRKSVVFYQTKFETQQKENKILLLSKADSIKNLKIANQQLALSRNLLELTRQKLALSGARLQLAQDSLHIAKQGKTILQAQLQASKRQEKIKSLSKEALRQKLILKEKEIALNRKNTTIGFILIAAILVFLIAYALYRKKQLEQKAVLAAEKSKQRELLTQAVIEAEETERKRIASDLHDGVGQLFSAVKMNLSGLFTRVELVRDEDRFLAEKTMALVDESCKEVRVISHKMMPNFLLKSGIASDIRSFIEKVDAETLKISFESQGFKEQMEFTEETILYRVIQELINNVIKHAQATELHIALNKTSTTISVQIEDNGIGFNLEEALEKGGLGMKNILVRVDYLKGKVHFEANKPSGTIVHIEIPI